MDQQLPVVPAAEPSEAQPIPPDERDDNDQTDWHLLFAMLQEGALVPLLISVFTELFANLKPIKIDVVLMRRTGIRWTLEQMARLPDGIRQSLARHILCEFKYTQSVNHATLVQALMYDLLYRSSRKLARKQVATFVVSARTPQASALQDFGYQATELAGIYRSTHKILEPITLIVLNELSREEHNALFKCFASRKGERDVAFAILEKLGAKQWSPELGEVLTGLRTIFQQQEGDAMSQSIITPEYVKQLGKQIHQAALANMTVEQRLAGLAPEQRLAGLAPEQRLAGLVPEQRLSGLSAETVLAHLASQQSLTEQSAAAVLSHFTPEVIEAYLRQRQQETADTKPRKPKQNRSVQQ